MLNEKPQVVRCEACGLWRLPSPLPHAPHLDAFGVLVDCIGRDVAK